jgi:energy-coupling factor transporter ATP-binding protein EcfA2
MRATTRNKGARDFLKQSKDERLNRFRAFTVKHPLLTKAYEELLWAVRYSNPGSIIFIYGPPGVGKTTLLKRLEKQLIELMLAELVKDPERLPVVKIRLDAPTSGSFDWKEFFKHLLIAMEEPLVDYKLNMTAHRNPHQSPASINNNMQLISSDKPGIRLMRFASEQTLKHRRPLAVLIDDAQHFGIVTSGRKLLDQLNTIKSLADKSMVTHALCGTYELIPLRNLNGQLSRRSINIQFGRYHADNEVHRKEFINVLYTFQQNLPLPEIPDLVARWDYFYERSIGCVGVLKDWLYHSLSLALESNSPTLPFKYVEQQALSISQCTTIMRETITGEKELEEREEERLILRRRLGLLNEDRKGNEGDSLLSDAARAASVKNIKRRHRVGTRSPVRDKIGVKIG